MATDKPIASVVFDPEVLYQTDIYIAEMTKAGTRMTRSTVVNAALAEYLQKRREIQEAANA